MNENIFGWDLLLDLYECGDQIASRQLIHDYVITLCERLGMKRFGEPLIEHFGYEKPETVGYSVVQLIETSAIVGHFSEFKHSAYLDIFSCKPFDPDEVAEFSRTWFGAQRVTKHFIERP